ncbi:MAG TPA: DUF554 family protein [Candidatus Acidoferrum sp.]|nr:DUF554 family protein [Candidatus Acidoferrum sp.]
MTGTFLDVASLLGGTLLNVAGILMGGLIGLARHKGLSPARESLLKAVLGAFAVFYGLRLTWMSLNGLAAQILKQLLVVVLALALGRLSGRLLRMQRASNRLGEAARERIAAAADAGPPTASDGFKTCAALFCAAPLGIVGSVQAGLSAYWYPLAVKAVMDGLASLGFGRLFGPAVLLSALPVLALQGTLTLICALWLKPWLAANGLVDPVNAVGGLLVFCVGLVIFGLKKFELADYLPSLAFAPLLSWICR